MIAELRQTQSLTNLVEAIDRWEAIAANLHSEALKLMVAEHTEFLKQQLDRYLIADTPLQPNFEGPAGPSLSNGTCNGLW